MRPYRDGTLTFYTDILLLYFELLYSCISGLAHSERYLTAPVLLFGIIIRSSAVSRIVVLLYPLEWIY